MSILAHVLLLISALAAYAASKHSPLWPELVRGRKTLLAGAAVTAAAAYAVLAKAGTLYTATFTVVFVWTFAASLWVVAIPLTLKLVGRAR